MGGRLCLAAWLLMGTGRRKSEQKRSESSISRVISFEAEETSIAVR